MLHKITNKTKQTDLSVLQDALREKQIELERKEQELFELEKCLITERTRQENLQHSLELRARKLKIERTI